MFQSTNWHLRRADGILMPSLRKYSSLGVIFYENHSLITSLSNFLFYFFTTIFMEFNFFIGGFLNEHFEIQSQNDYLLIFCGFNAIFQSKNLENSNHKISVKDNKDWQNIISFIESSNWNQEYESQVIDGLQWTLYFENHVTKVKCNGNNNFPDNFNTFLDLIRVMLKRHKINCNIDYP